MSEKQSFESLSKELDEIIKKLEDGNLTLDESVKLFEQAEQKIKLCEMLFKDVKGTITVIKNNVEKDFIVEE